MSGLGGEEVGQDQQGPPPRTRFLRPPRPRKFPAMIPATQASATGSHETAPRARKGKRLLTANITTPSNRGREESGTFSEMFFKEKMQRQHTQAVQRGIA